MSIDELNLPSQENSLGFHVDKLSKSIQETGGVDIKTSELPDGQTLRYTHPLSGEEIVLHIESPGDFAGNMDQIHLLGLRLEQNNTPNYWIEGGIQSPIKFFYGATIKDLRHLAGYTDVLLHGLSSDPLLDASQHRKYLDSTSLAGGYLHTNVVGLIAGHSAPRAIQITFTSSMGDSRYNASKLLPTVNYMKTAANSVRVTCVQQVGAGGSISAARLNSTMLEKEIRKHIEAGNYDSIGKQNLAELLSFLDGKQGIPSHSLYDSLSALSDVQLEHLFMRLRESQNIIDVAKSVRDNQKVLVRAYNQGSRFSDAPPAHVISMANAIAIYHRHGIRNIEIPTHLPIQAHVKDDESSGNAEVKLDSLHRYITYHNMKLAIELSRQIPGAELYESHDDHMLTIELPDKLSFRNSLLNDLVSTTGRSTVK